MDFHDSPEQSVWRDEVRSFIQAEQPERDEAPMVMERGRNPKIKAWRDKLSTKGWIAPAWPKEYGGAGLGVMEQFIMNEEFAEARVPECRRHGHLHDRPHDHHPRQRRAEEGAPRRHPSRRSAVVPGL